MRVSVNFTPDDWDDKDGPIVSPKTDGTYVIAVALNGDLFSREARELAGCLIAAADECDRRNGVM